MAFGTFPDFKFNLAQLYKAASRIGPSLSLGDLILSVGSEGTGEADPPVALVPAEATDHVL